MRRSTRLGAAAALLLCKAAGAVAATAPAHAATTLISKNWAGYITTAPSGQHVNMVSAEWMVPKASPRHSVGMPPYQAAMWAGMRVQREMAHAAAAPYRCRG
jgi:hypothetical protein